MTPQAGAKIAEAALTAFVAIVARGLALDGEYVLAIVMFGCACIGAWLVLRRQTA